ncbi:MAG: hypothetical protein GXP16_03660 [Gammaproteobacteria bacterium]|nr:hypothetical protein [Gammaproteobacteria bacterium]
MTQRMGVHRSLERLCRYGTRPPLALDRLSTRATGEVVYELKHPFKDGATLFVFEPIEFLAKLAALVPRLRANLTRYHGVLAPNCKYRRLVVPTPNNCSGTSHLASTWCFSRGSASALPRLQIELTSSPR